MSELLGNVSRRKLVIPPEERQIWICKVSVTPFGKAKVKTEKGKRRSFDMK